jgi:hypothetical protein
MRATMDKMDLIGSIMRDLRDNHAYMCTRSRCGRFLHMHPAELDASCGSAFYYDDFASIARRYREIAAA